MVNSKSTHRVVNQDPSVLSTTQLDNVSKQYLPILVDSLHAIESCTGYRWKITSYVRNSPSHSKGIALDVAPDIHPSALNHYSVTHGSDPVLYKRGQLIRKLQKGIKSLPEYSRYSVGWFIEPDHIHIHLFEKTIKPPYNRLTKWKVVKPVYADSQLRSSGTGMIN